MLPTPTILIADDDPTILDFCTEALEDAGYHVLQAHHGAEVLNTLRQTLPTVLLLDIMMPFFDGITICQRLRADARTAHIPIALMSAQTHLLRAQQDGCAAVPLAKPFELERLLATIRYLLDTAPT